MTVTTGPPEVAKPAKPRRRSSGSKLFAHDRRLGVRWVAGADEAGRGCLAGPLVAAAVLFDLEAITPREVRTLSALNDSKQHTPEARAGSTGAGCTARTWLRCATRCAGSRARTRCA